jgi:hypothetical protein
MIMSRMAIRIKANKASAGRGTTPKRVIPAPEQDGPVAVQGWIGCGISPA